MNAISQIFTEIIRMYSYDQKKSHLIGLQDFLTNMLFGPEVTLGKPWLKSTS